MKREFFIAGVQFRPQVEIRATASVLKTDDVLLLEPEPTNRFDPNAIKIIYPEEQIFLGYVPKRFSSEVAGLLEAGIDLECIVQAVDLKAKTYEMFKVVIQEHIEEDIEDDNLDEVRDLMGESSNFNEEGDR